MFRFLLNFIGFLLSFVFTEKIMHEVWHLRNVIYSSIERYLDRKSGALLYLCTVTIQFVFFIRIIYDA